MTPCDKSERDVLTNGALADELAHTRTERDACAAQIDGLAQWRKDVIKRAQ